MLARSTAACIRPPLALLRASFPAFVLDVLRTLDGAGYRSWLVGGAVRALLLRRKRSASDHDVATPARPDQVMALFPKVVPTGLEHGTVTVVLQGAPVEVTPFRGEGAYVDGRRPSSVTFLDEVDEDLARRDFTVNALAYDPVGKAFRDPFGGRDDLRRGIIRAVGDPLDRDHGGDRQRRRYGGQGGGVEREVELRSEAHGAQRAQTVLGEARGRLPNGPEQTVLQVTQAPGGVYDL